MYHIGKINDFYSSYIYFLFFLLKMSEKPQKNNETDFIKLLKVFENEPIAITESNQILIG